MPPDGPDCPNSHYGVGHARFRKSGDVATDSKSGAGSFAHIGNPRTGRHVSLRTVTAKAVDDSASRSLFITAFGLDLWRRQGQKGWRMRARDARGRFIRASKINVRSAGHRKHGHNDGFSGGSPTYRSWLSAVQRTTNPRHQGYRHYGAAGVKVRTRWRRFTHFLADMGERPEGTSLGRALDTGNYEPGNAFWQTQEEQLLARMNKRALMKWNTERQHATEIESRRS